MQTFDKFLSARPFVTFSWEETHMDRIFGDFAPNGSDNYVWLVYFDLDKFVKAGLENAQPFIDLAKQAIADIKPAGELKIAPMSQLELNQIWAGSACGYEDQNIREYNSDPEICNNRFEDRVARMITGEQMNIQEMNASFQRRVGGVGKKFKSNREAAELFAAAFNKLTGVADLAVASEYVYNDNSGYSDYGGECTC